MAKVSFTETVTGQERKAIAGIIAEVLGGTPSYAGAPSFAYTTGGWSINKNSHLVSPELDMDSLPKVAEVISALSNAGLNTDGSLRIIVHGIGENEANLLASVIASKATLLKKALQFAGPLAVVHEGDSVALPFFNATLDADKVCAYLTLAQKLAGFAQTLKYCSAVDKEVDNTKYALRCFLLRLGFIGDEYKSARKVLLAPLEGNTAFKTIPAAGEVDAGC